MNPVGEMFGFGVSPRVEYVGRVRDDLRLETEKLTRSWAQHDSGWLGNYLVAGVEDPRLNLQSILSRHFLIRSLMADPPEALMVAEYRFAAAMSWLTSTSDLVADPEARAATLDALRRESDNAEGLEIPPFVSHAFQGLPFNTDEGVQVDNYVEHFLRGGPSVALLDTFAEIWCRVLSNLHNSAAIGLDGRFPEEGATTRTQGPPTLLEPACGSANDYRFLHTYGIAQWMDYTGFDLCEKNVENARQLFPGTQFVKGNVFEIAAPDKSFELCVVHDLFEHLSPAGIEQAVREVCRVTRRGMCLGFFQMAEIPEHVIRPRDDYYWNLLSMARMKHLFTSHGFVVQAIHVDSFLYQHTGAPGAHNPDAYTFLLRSI